MEWRSVVGYEGRYSVSSLGQVRNDQTGRVRSLNVKGGSRGGHLMVDWNTSGKKEYFKVHHLVLEAFVGPRPDGMHGLHRDDDKTNNSVENLYWGTHFDNMQDKVRNGNHHCAKKTECGKCGSPLSGENLYLAPNGSRKCRHCRRVQNVERYHADIEKSRARQRAWYAQKRPV